MDKAMAQKRIIHVTDGSGKTIYTGEDKRFYSGDYPKCKFGIPISDWLKVCGFTLAFIVTFTTMRIDINDVKATSVKFEQYIENHDDWDSAFFHVRFKDGEPLDRNFQGANFK